MRIFACTRHSAPAALLIALAAIAAPSVAMADPVCTLPITAYLTDAAGVPLDGVTDVEIAFYASGDPAELPLECRSAADVPVADGWLRLTVDACAPPPLEDCGVAPLISLMGGEREDLFVGITLGSGGDELPRMRTGAVPFAVRSLSSDDSERLEGRAAADFEAAGSIDAHAANPDAHHSSSSDSLDLTPASVTTGGVRMDNTGVDFGPDTDDSLSAEMVRTLTGGGSADALHTHSAGGGVAGGCYTAWGIETCLDGYRVAYAGVIVMPAYSSAQGAGAADLICAHPSGFNIGTSSIGGNTMRLSAGAASTVSPAGDDPYANYSCALCCP